MLYIRQSSFSLLLAFENEISLEFRDFNLNTFDVILRAFRRVQLEKIWRTGEGARLFAGSTKTAFVQHSRLRIAAFSARAFEWARH